MLHGDFAVLVLAALVLAGHHDAGGDMGDADGRLGLVDVLAARTAGAIGVHLAGPRRGSRRSVSSVISGITSKRSKGGVPAAAGIKGRHPHQAVHSRLALQIAIGVKPLDEDRPRF